MDDIFTGARAAQPGFIEPSFPTIAGADGNGAVIHYRADREGADRVENLEELENAAESFVTIEGFGRGALSQSPASQGLDLNQPVLDEPAPDADSGETMSPLSAFLSHAALEAGDNQAQAGQDAVQLMTVHASKGLEFDAVFITGMEEGLFPHEHSMSDRDGLEEERRLMYVAITRARKRVGCTVRPATTSKAASLKNCPRPR